LSYEVELSYPRLVGVITKFIDESTLILDESVPLPRRAALLYKWSWILHGLGYDKPLDHTDLSDEEIKREAARMLKWIAHILRESKR